MEFGVWFADEMKRIMQSIATTGDDYAAVARAEGDPKLLQAYQAGFHAALRSMAQALDIEPPDLRGEVTLQFVQAKEPATRATRKRGGHERGNGRGVRVSPGASATT